MDPILSEVISRVPGWAAANDLTITPLGGGITNRNFRVDVGGESFVVRIGGANTELLGIRREAEYAASKAAASIGVAPEVVHFLLPEGILVTRFIRGRPLTEEEIRRPEGIRRVAGVLKKIHGMPAIPGSFSPFRVVEAYAEIGRRFQVELPENFAWLMERKSEIEAAFLRKPFVPCPCHNDLLIGNFLDDGEIRVLDWEYAGMGDPAFDLANFAVNHGFLEEHDRALLQAYYGEVAPSGLARLRLMKVMSDFREAMWGIVQIGISQLEFDFREYAGKHFRRLAHAMGEPGWRRRLEEA